MKALHFNEGEYKSNNNRNKHFRTNNEGFLNGRVADTTDNAMLACRFPQIKN